MSSPLRSQPADSRLEMLLEALPEPALLLARDRTILAANETYLSTFAGGQTVCGRSCFEVCHHRSRPCSEESGGCPLERCLETRRPVSTLHVHGTPAGDLHTNVTMRPLFDRDGELDSLLEVLEPVRIASAIPTRRLQLVGRSPTFLRLLSTLQRIGPTEKPALIVGEPGTGKELVARTLHELSPRRDGAFVPVDCSALRDWQFERELFGHAQGAFPGAEAARGGLVQAAKGGSLFLKEVETLPIAVQVRLLRLLETGVYLREGSTRAESAQFRLLCSASVDLARAVERGEFREDLRLRIGAFPIEVPALRERVEDIPLLVESLLQRLSCQPASRQVHPDTLEMLARHALPGNLRELANAVERACLNAQGGVILPEHLPEAYQKGRPEEPPSLEFDGEIVSLAEAERLYLEWARRRAGCSQAELARRLGISERTLYRKLSDTQASRQND